MTTTVPTTTTSSTYPLPQPASDPRFTFGLTYDVKKVLEAAGYPEIGGVDIIALQQALYRFLYTEDSAR